MPDTLKANITITLIDGQPWRGPITVTDFFALIDKEVERLKIELLCTHKEKHG